MIINVFNNLLGKQSLSEPSLSTNLTDEEMQLIELLVKDNEEEPTILDWPSHWK